MTKTKIVRVVAKYSENSTPSGSARLTLICGINQDTQIADGEWVGFTHNNDIHHPFILRKEPFEHLLFGGHKKWYEPSNLVSTKMAVGNKFTIASHPDDPEGDWSSEYTITSVHNLA